MAEVLACSCKEGGFELSSRYKILFWTNTIMKDINFLIIPEMG